jgi:hypothetical protein
MDEKWKIVHRHADPLTERHPVDDILTFATFATSGRSTDRHVTDPSKLDTQRSLSELRSWARGVSRRRTMSGPTATFA